LARYLDRIVARFKRQEAKGISKYGQILEDNPRGLLEALEYLAEELTDGLMYVEEAIEKAEQIGYRTPLAENEARIGRAERQLIKLQEEVEKYQVIAELAVLAYKSGQICGLDNGYVGRLANAVAELKGVEE
jgi:phage shock protein A